MRRADDRSLHPNPPATRDDRYPKRRGLPTRKEDVAAIPRGVRSGWRWNIMHAGSTFELSQALAAGVEAVAPSLVRIDAGRRPAANRPRRGAGGGGDGAHPHTRDG